MSLATNVMNRTQDLIFPVGIIGCVIVILVPLPPAILDVLLSANIAVAVVILLTTISIGSPLEFSVFPTMLVATTLARLVLNIATTRLILTRTDSDGLGAAGGVIEAFGEFVAGDRLAVGIILFVIIFLINFIVISKGATRIGEVAARFALDGMPGRQMAVDADLSAGAIDEKEAQRRRDEITRQADFYGAMDGASKFVRGDAIAGIIITFINIIGGLFIGYVYAGMTLLEAAEIFTKLTIGDGLVSQIPGFLISLAAAILTTRSTQQSSLPRDFLGQIFSHPQALVVSGAFLLLLMFTQLPTIPLLTMGCGCIGLAATLQKRQKVKVVQEAKSKADAAAVKSAPPEKKVEDYLELDAMRVELGLKLLVLADPNRGGDITKRISTVRATLAGEMGILLPTVRMKDRLSLQEYAYEIQIGGNRVDRGMIRPDRVLAIDTGLTTGRIDGEETVDPAFRKKAFWIDPSRRQQAEIYGYQIVDPGAVLATHIQEVARRHADELLTRDVTKQLLDQLKKTTPTVVEELVPAMMKVAEVQQILQNLLREDVPIRNLAAILETLGNNAGKMKDPVWLTECVRVRLGRTISQRYRDSNSQLRVIMLDPAVEDRIAAGTEHTERGLFIRMSPSTIKTTCQQISDQMKKLDQLGRPRCLLVSPRIRASVRQITQETMPELRVLSFHEISTDTNIESVGMVTDSVTK